MFDLSTETFSSKELIAILFKEYDTLRAEILSRSHSHHQLIAITATLIGAILTFGAAKVDFTLGLANANVFVALGLAFALACAGTTALLIARRGTMALGSRVAELEARINNLAGSQLLLWETRHGSGTGGWFRLFHISN